MIQFLETSNITCGGADVLKVIKFAMILLKALCNIIAIALVVLVAIDFIKGIIEKNAEGMNKQISVAIKRFIICLCLFLVPTITQATMLLLGNLGVDFATCITIAETEDLSQYEINYPEVNNNTNANFGGDGQGITPIEREDTDSDLNNSSSGSSSNNSSGSSNNSTDGNSNSNPITGTYDISNKKNLVSIMYSTWFDAIMAGPTPGIISNTPNPSINTYYCWGTPAGGFYKSSDKTRIKQHMQQLSSAGIDFIILDNTNLKPENGFTQGSALWNSHVTSSMTAILDTMVLMRKQGQKTPYVVNWVYTGHTTFSTWNSVNSLYDQFYSKQKYKDLWVYWDKKPFIITTTTPTTSPSKSITTRSMWGLSGVSNYNWSYLEKNNDQPGRGPNGEIEQIGVSTAMQETYMSNTSTATGRNKGETFYKQWTTAFKYHPKIVTITWWNEWCAINIGNRTYTDLYNQEYSRDIEPMKGGHGAQYYNWMKKYISSYKSNKSCPHLTS